VATNPTESSRRGVAAFWMRALAGIFRQEGLDVEALFQDAGSDLAALDNPDLRVPSATVNRLWQLAVERSGNPTIGLTAARVPRPVLFDIVGYAMMSSPDLRGLLERTARYFRIITDVVTFTVAEEPDGYRVRLATAADEADRPWQRYMFTLLSLLSFVRWIMMRDLRPLAVEVIATARDEMISYQQAFECPLRFGAQANALLFSYSDIALGLPTAQPRLAGVHERVVGEYLARLDEPGTTARVRIEISQHLADGEPRRATIARALGMSERTLQRRLEDENTSYRRILDDTRKELARNYFEQGDVSLTHMSYLLGFNDQSSFFRATQRWFGTTPQQFRLRNRPRPPE
jgi:AraC-like DNA-binding protein